MRSEPEQQVDQNYLYQMGTRKKQVCPFSRGRSLAISTFPFFLLYICVEGEHFLYFFFKILFHTFYHRSSKTFLWLLNSNLTCGKEAVAKSEIVHVHLPLKLSIFSNAVTSTSYIVSFTCACGTAFVAPSFLIVVSL